MTSIRFWICIPIYTLFFSTALLASPKQIMPIGESAKDQMFAQEKPYLMCNYPIRTPECSDLCTLMKVKYDEMKNINGRDTNPKRGLAKPEWFDLNGLQQRQISIPTTPPYVATEIRKAPPGALFTADTDEEVKREYPGSTYTTMSVNVDKEQPNESADKLTTYEVGKPGDPNCKWATIWVHGATPWRGGLGMNDTIFGGSFNRMKQLAQNNNGLYYSPTIQDFGDTRGLTSLIRYIRQKSCPKGKIILNCGSAGVSVCWDVANDKSVLNELSGMVLIGGGAPYEFQSTNFAKARIPLLLAQGERDHPEPLQELVEKVHKEDPKYPIRFMVFQTGGHMTPLRMLDWRATMNCMLTQAPETRDQPERPAVSSPSESNTAN